MITVEIMIVTVEKTDALEMMNATAVPDVLWTKISFITFEDQLNVPGPWVLELTMNTMMKKNRTTSP